MTAFIGYPPTLSATLVAEPVRAGLEKANLDEKHQTLGILGRRLLRNQDFELMRHQTHQSVFYLVKANLANISNGDCIAQGLL
jgi:hypothetical protein